METSEIIKRYISNIENPKMQRGGTVDMYDNEIKAPIQYKDIPRSFYDSRRGIINAGEDYKNLLPQEQKELIAHENRHDWQYRNDRSNFNITHNPDYAFNDRLQKKPGITTTDEVYNNYHNRQQKETDTTLNNFKQNFPQFSFIPNQVLYDKNMTTDMYDDKFSLEGEAQYYQKTGQKSFQQGGLSQIDSLLNANKDKLFIDRMINSNNYPIMNNLDKSHSTHKLAWGESDNGYVVYPTINYKDNKLFNDPNGKYAFDNNDFIQFKDKGLAERFANGDWKQSSLIKNKNTFKKQQGGTISDNEKEFLKEFAKIKINLIYLQ